MQTKLTWILTSLALALFAFILFFERRVPGTAERLAPSKVLSAVNPGDIRAVEVTLRDGEILRAEQTNGVWFLTKPFYPARQTAVESFITNLTSLRQFDLIPQPKVALEGQKAFGLEPPQATITIETATNQVHLQIGSRAPLTNNMYLRVKSSPDVILSGAELLGSLPRSADDWRSEKLLHFGQVASSFDHLKIRSGQRFFELGKNPTNQLWQITRPIPARGDQDSIAVLFDQLARAQVSRFVGDRVGDLERYGLQSPAAEITFSRGNNPVLTIQFGASVPEDSNHVYARLLGNSNVVTVSSQLLDFLKQPYKAFHDPRLLAFSPEALDRVATKSLETYSIRRQSSGRWVIENAQPIPADAELVDRFLQTILSMRILDIAKEVPTDADLQALGLQSPRVSFSFYHELTNAAGVRTNALLCDLNFGANLTDRIYVRRSDETPVYITELAPLVELPHQAFRLRDRQIWNFSTNAVVRVTVGGPAGTNSATRSNGGWTADPLASAAIEEAIFRMSRLEAVRWVAKGQDALAQAGITPASQALEVELRTNDGPEILRIPFGKSALRHNVYATSPDIPGEPLVFEFPGEVYHLLLQNLPAAK